jgi:hypothetical protein
MFSDMHKKPTETLSNISVAISCRFMVYFRKSLTEVTEMSNSLELIRKNFGFGFMRLPMNGEEVDIPQTIQMVDLFLENGFNCVSFCYTSLSC